MNSGLSLETVISCTEYSSNISLLYEHFYYVHLSTFISKIYAVSLSMTIVNLFFVFVCEPL